jgi:hypothetical protein
MARGDLLGAAERDRRTAVREIGIVVLGALVYFGVRLLVEGGTARSMANGQRILDAEQRLGIDIEQRVQEFVLEHDAVRALGNASYIWLHWPLLIVVLVVVFRRDRTIYVRLRRALMVSGLAGLVLFWSTPTAPPRFMPGFEGTVSDAARTHYIGYPLSWANRYASMPSFHVGWTALACLALAATMTSRRWRVAAMLPAVLVALAVVTTGNHYVLDATVGLAIAVAAYAAAARSWPVSVAELSNQWRRARLVSPWYASGGRMATPRVRIDGGTSPSSGIPGEPGIDSEEP